MIFFFGIGVKFLAILLSDFNVAETVFFFFFVALIVH